MAISNAKAEHLATDILFAWVEQTRKSYEIIFNYLSSMSFEPNTDEKLFAVRKALVNVEESLEHFSEVLEDFAYSKRRGYYNSLVEYNQIKEEKNV